MRQAFWLMAGLVVLADQATKFLVEARLPLGGPSVPLIPGGLYLTHVRNQGVAFGQLAGLGSGPLLVVAVLAAAGILLYRARVLQRDGALHPVLQIGLALPLGGAVGNVIDRLRLGEVVDFIDLRWWPVFNLADTAITVGAVLLAAYSFLHHRPEPSREAAGEAAGE